MFANLTFASVWAWRSLASSDGFADMVTSVLDDRDVRAGLADQIVRSLETRDVTSRFAVTVQPLLTEVVRDVVDTDAFKAIFRAGRRELHVSVTRGHELPVARVDIDDAVPIVRDGLRAFNPALADAITTEQLRVVVSLSQSHAIDWTMRASSNAAWAVLPLAVLSLSLFLLAVARAPMKRRAVESAGAVFALAGVVLLVVLRVAGHDLSLIGRSAGEQRAVRAIFNVVTRLLEVQARAAVVAGVAVAVAANYAANPAAKRRLSVWLRGVPAEVGARPALRLTVALLVAATATSALVWPGTVLAVAVRATATVALVVVAVTMLEMLGARTWAINHDPAQLRRARQLAGRATLSVAGMAVALLVAGTAAVAAARAPHPRQADPDRYGCNGSVELCDRRLDEVTFVGTHNSMSVAGMSGGWLMARQTKGFDPQLRDGVRAFLVDLHYGVQTGEVVRTDFLNELEGDRADVRPSEEQVGVLRRLFAMIGATSPTGKKHVYLCHDFCEMGSYDAERAFRKIDDFLRNHPEQVVLLILDDHVSSQDGIDVLQASGLADRAYSWTPGEPLPTLRDMVTSGRNVFVMAERRGGPAAWYVSAYSQLLQDTPYSFPTMGSMSCDLGRGTAANPLLLVNHWLDVDTPTPQIAAQANAATALAARVERCESERHRRVNIIAVDFYDQGDVFKVVDEMNGVGRGADAPEKVTSRVG